MKRLVILIGLCICLLQACQNVPEYENVYSEDNCIQPPMVYAQNDADMILAQGKTLPLAPWSVTKEPSDDSLATFGGHTIALIQPADDHDKIWLSSCWRDENEPSMCNYIIFRTDTKTTRQVTQPANRFGESFPEYLFLSKEKDVWGIIISGSNEDIPNLSIYNEQKQTFEPVKDIDNILNTAKHSRFNDYTVDENGILWLIGSWYVYKFDPETLKADEFSVGLTNPDENLTDLTLTSDGFIYLTIGTKKELLRFSTADRSIEKIDIPIHLNEVQQHQYHGPPFKDDLYKIRGTFIDSTKRLWVHNYGWMEPDGAWYAMIGKFSGFFGINVVEARGYEDYYDWFLPDIILESSDGRLWFRSENGMTWLDPDKGEWCWFTTYQSNIVEDQEGNLWMIADNKLYTLDLEQ